MTLGIIGFVLSLGLSFFAYPRFIELLHNSDLKQQVSEYALDEFKGKKQTPTFGGLIFVLIPIVVSLVLNGIKFSQDLLMLIFVFASFALVGLVDDYKIVKEGKNDGISPAVKMGSQLVLALVFYFIYRYYGGNTIVSVPFIKDGIDIGFFYIPFVMLILSGSSNAVNLTDGMDGLAGGTTLIALIPFVWIALQAGRLDILMFIMCVIGGLAGFLIYNHKPAQIFMGDVGSLALGALLASISILLSKELLLVVIGFVFVFETVTVIMQRISWKVRKKRIFRYTPIHYSFTLAGWKEQDVVNFFYIMGVIVMVIGLALNAWV